MARRWRSSVLLAGLLAAGLAGCTSTSTTAPTAPVVVAPAVPITLGELVGNWGLASFRNEADQARTAAQAKAACGNPYKITQGPRGGVLMYLADQTQPSEVFLKVAPDGKTFIGPQGPPAMRQDRLVISFDKGVLVAAWVDPSVATRYGTMILVRCGTK